MNRALTKRALIAASILGAGLMASTAGAKAADDAIGVVAGVDTTQCSVTLTTGQKFYEATEDRDSDRCGTLALPAERVLISFNRVDGQNVIADIQRYRAEDAIGQVTRLNADTLTLANGESFDLDALTGPEPAVSVGDYVLVEFTETLHGQNVAASVALADAASDSE